MAQKPLDTSRNMYKEECQGNFAPYCIFRGRMFVRDRIQPMWQHIYYVSPEVEIVTSFHGLT
jgi:hypothetical protein